MNKRSFIRSLIVLGVISMSPVFNSCTDTEELAPVSNNPELLDFDFNQKTAYDKSLEKLAFAVNEALQNDEFKSLIRNSVEEGYTHDYDVPLQNFKGKSMNKTARGLNVSAFLENIIYPGGSSQNQSAKKATFLDELTEAYPDLMFSVPVNVEKIDEGVKPYVLYIPENFKDVTYKRIRAINPEGKIEYLSLEEEPDFPVVVIHKREGEVGKSEMTIKTVTEAQARTAVHDDINMIVKTHSAGVQITWTKRSDVSTYKLYRYKHTVRRGTDAEAYELITTFTNGNSNSYVDEKTYSSMPTNVYYERYRMIVTYNDGYVATYYAEPNEKLADVKIGDVSSLGNKIIQVNWSKLNNDVLVGYNVYRASSITSDNTNSGNVWDNGWLLCNSQMLAPHLTSWTDYDAGKIPGKAYFYRVLPRSYSDEQDWNFQASSNAQAAKYINVAICSDRSDNAQLIATHIKTKDISKLEGWIYGKPEFQFAVFGYSTLSSTFDSGTPKRLYEFSLDGEKRKKYNDGLRINKTMLLKWSNDLNLEIVAVVGYEHDDDSGGWDAIAMKLKNLAIDLIQKTVQTKTGVDMSSLTDVLKSQRGDTYAGGAYIIRSGKENVTLKLDQGKGGKDQEQSPQGGVMLRISTTTSSSGWSSSWDNDIVQLEDDKY